MMILESLSNIRFAPWTLPSVTVGATGIGVANAAKEQAEVVVLGFVSLESLALWVTIAAGLVGVVGGVYKMILMRRYERRAEAVAEVMDEAERTQREAIARHAVESSWGKPPKKWFRK